MTSHTTVDVISTDVGYQPKTDQPSAMGVDGSKPVATRSESMGRLVKLMMSVILVILACVIIVVMIIVAKPDDDDDGGGHSPAGDEHSSVAVCTDPDTSSITWTYDSHDHTMGPSHWKDIHGFETCGLNKQSPINIDSTSATLNATLATISSMYSVGDGCTEYKGETNDHTLELADLQLCEHKLTLNHGGSEYVMKQLHFHSPSEHTVDGKHYAGEIHFVFVPAGNFSGTGPVVGVFLDASAREPSPAETFLTSFTYDNHAHTAATPIDPVADFFPADKSYYSYTGSYTTPPCYDDVIPWMVLKTPVEVSHQWLAGYLNTLSKLPQTYLSLTNNRPIQTVGTRAVDMSA